MEKGNKAAIVCCSNGQPLSNKGSIDKLEYTLRALGLAPVLSRHIYETDSVFSGSGRDRAQALMKAYQDEEIKVIFDISGGDIANEILPFLDYEQIAQTDKKFWGYSDLTTVINAIYTKTGKASVLYQVKNLIYEDEERQRRNFLNTVFQNKNDLYSFGYHFVQQEQMQGIVVGGNIRCLLKLAGTEYWPDMNEKILLLESRSGEVPQMVTYLNQLKQMRVFDKISGILLGTFSRMQEKKCTPDIMELVKQYAGREVPIAVTDEIGHGVDSKGIIIGKEMLFDK
ncbi:MAG: LD-carboxypeptidase [Bacteroides sp.]|nr:LD-carboxypeptidase [Bacteroides sp.]MCM1549735.1 LD-carboxypeptidase [Clostridium sp.]